MAEDREAGQSDATTGATGGPKGGAGRKGLKEGLAGRMAHTFVRSPVTPLLYLAALLFGLIGFLVVPYQENPQISVPFVDIFVQYPGASSQQVERLVTEPLERLMSELDGIKHVYGVSRPGQAIVTVRFKVGERKGPALVRLFTKLFSHLDMMPAGVSPRPLVVPKGINDVPILNITLWSKTVGPARLDDIGQAVLQKLMSIPDTNSGFIVRGQRTEMHVQVLPDRLASYGIPLTRIAQTVKAANAAAQVGHITQSGQYFKVYTGAFLRSAQELRGLVVGVYRGSPVYLGQVAEVAYGPGPMHRVVQMYRGKDAHAEDAVNGAPAVTLAIAKKAGANNVVVGRAVTAKLHELERNLIPDDVHVTVTRNFGRTAEEKVDELLFKLVLETLLVAVLIYLVLGLRPAVVTLLVIPVVILFTVFVAFLTGFSLNRVSLFALILAIAILVDDAIVVVENIYRRWLAEGRVSVATTVDAVREVGNPTIIATLTVVVALVPMAFVTGLMGPYMIAIPVLGSVAMLFSLFAAFVYTPYLVQRFPPSLRRLRKQEEKEHRQAGGLLRFYRRLLGGLLDNRWRGRLVIVLIVVGLVGVMALFYTKDVIMKMLPYDNVDRFDVVLDMRAGTPAETTYNVARQLVERLRTLPHVKDLQLYVATPQPFSFNGMVRHYYLRFEPWQAMIHVDLSGKSHRELKSHDIAIMARRALDAVLKNVDAPVKSLQIVEAPPGPPVRQSMVAVVYGPDQKSRDVFAEQLTEMFKKAPSVADVSNELQFPYWVWRFHIDRTKAGQLGVSDQGVAQNLALALGDKMIASLRHGSVFEPTPVVLNVPMSVRADAGKLMQLPIATAGGSTVPLIELGYPSLSREDPVLYQEDLRPVTYVTGASVGRLAAPLYGIFEVNDMLVKAKLPTCNYVNAPSADNQIGCHWTGAWTVTYETFRDMGTAFLVAFFGIYILLAWEFQGLVLPAIVMAPIPLTILGIVPGHWLFDAPFTATSMIGFIALMGIIVRNSILLVDFAQRAVAEEDMPVREAVIRACATRTRPILITAVVLMIGSLFIIGSPIFQGMGLSLFFGTLVSTLLALVVVPLGLSSAGAYILPKDRRDRGDEPPPEPPPAPPGAP
ncbi:MAG: efflux RND transporter permease subunit, partial [Gammaproteobacteria bacterium]